MYIRVPQNRLSLTIIKSISTESNSIPPLVIVPREMIIESWFNKNMTGHEVITMSPSGYTNKANCIVWLDYFINHYNCGPNQPQRILLIDRVSYHKASEFILKAKIYYIWIIKFPSH